MWPALISAVMASTWPPAPMIAPFASGAQKTSWSGSTSLWEPTLSLIMLPWSASVQTQGLTVCILINCGYSHIIVPLPPSLTVILLLQGIYHLVGLWRHHPCLQNDQEGWWHFHLQSCCWGLSKETYCTHTQYWHCRDRYTLLYKILHLPCS